MIKRIQLFILIQLAISHVALSQVDDTTFQEIEEVLISTTREKKIAFEDPKYYIVDFTVSDSSALLLMRNFRTYYVYELDAEMNFRHKLELNFDADFLFEDCFGNTHVVSRDSAYFVMTDASGMYITEKHRRRQFMGAMKRCVGSTSEKIVFEQKSNFNQDQTYYTVDIDSGDRKIVYELKDSELSRSMREATAQLHLQEYRSIDKVREGNLGGTVADDVNSQRIKNGNQDRAMFIASHVLKPKYNPLFTVDDTLFVFNHIDGVIAVIDDKGEIHRTIPITYHFKKNWDKKVYVDRARRQFYAVYLRNGVEQLVRLALTDEEQNSISEITKHAYPKKVLVRNGYAYYTYKPNFDANLNKLYRQKL